MRCFPDTTQNFAPLNYDYFKHRSFILCDGAWIMAELKSGVEGDAKLG